MSVASFPGGNGIGTTLPAPAAIRYTAIPHAVRVRQVVRPATSVEDRALAQRHAAWQVVEPVDQPPVGRERHLVESVLVVGDHEPAVRPGRRLPQGDALAGAAARELHRRRGRRAGRLDDRLEHLERRDRADASDHRRAVRRHRDGDALRRRLVEDGGRLKPFRRCTRPGGAGQHTDRESSDGGTSDHAALLIGDGHRERTMPVRRPAHISADPRRAP